MTTAGDAFVGWTDGRSPIYARASRPDGNTAGLVSWWAASAGPLAPGTRPLAAKSARVAPGTLIYGDSLASPAGGWARGRTAAGERGYAGGGYRILVRKNVALGSHTAELPVPLLFHNITAQVTAQRAGGPQNFSAGIICRVSTVAGKLSYYALQVRSDGLLRIRKSVQGRFRELGRRSLGHSISQARISAGCRGGGAKPVLLSVSANGSAPLQARDRAGVATGAVGLLAQPFDRPGTAIRFTDLAVKQAG